MLPWDLRAAPEFQNEAIDQLAVHCLALTAIEIDRMTPVAEKALTRKEKELLVGLGVRRRRSFLAARLALKRLVRKIDNDWTVPAGKLQTVAEDGIHPLCPSKASLFCSVSHDRRLVVAAAATAAVGIDVERIDQKAFKTMRLYMSAEERRLVKNTPLPPAAAAVRVWSAKEAAAKALNLELAKSWRVVQCVDIGENQSSLLFNGALHPVFHRQVDDGLITLLVLPPENEILPPSDRSGDLVL